MDKKPQIMYICPKQCEGCPLGEPHYDSGDCGKAYTLCPACIPHVEPSPKDCSKCGQLDCDRAEPQPEHMPLISMELKDVLLTVYEVNEHFDKPRATEYELLKKQCLKLIEASLSMHQALEDIHDIAIGYDGFGTVKSLKKLVDELRELATKGLIGKYHIEIFKDTPKILEQLQKEALVGTTQKHSHCLKYEDHIWKKWDEDGAIYCEKCNYEKDYLDYLQSKPLTPNLNTKCPECGHPIITHNRYGCQARYPVCLCSKTRSDLVHESDLEYKEERESHSKPVKIEINSKVPSKWRFVDLETGDIWKWDEVKGTFIDTEAREVLDGLNLRK